MATLKEKLEQRKNEIGLVGTRLNFSRSKEGKGISEHITHDWSEIVIKIKEDLDLAPDKETRNYLLKSGIKDPLEKIAIDLLYHGCGHRELPTETGLGCPYTIENHDRVVSGVARALKEVHKSGLESYVSNAFEDVLDNTNAKRHTDHTGQVLFWNNEGLENNGTYTPFYEAFVTINLMMMGEPKDATLLKRFYTREATTKKAVKEFTDYLKVKLGIPHLVRVHQKEDAFRRLFDKNEWEEMAYRFTKALAPLLEDQPKMRMCFGKSPTDSSPFDDKLKLPEYQEKIAEGRYKSGSGPSAHTEPQVQLDALYKKISRSIPVKTSEYTRASAIPIATYGRKQINLDEDFIKMRRIKGIGFNEEGELILKQGRHELKHPATYKVHPRKFPPLKISLLDRSGSMKLSPQNTADVGTTTFIPWGDKSKYHYALKGIYGIDNYLQNQGIANYVQSEAIVFSDSTSASGKRKLRSEEERRTLLRMPSGGTTLDVKLLESETSEKCFLISISDGEIANWEEIKEQYKATVAKTDYCHIHIGSPNAFTQDVASWGINVHYVKGDDDLSRLMLDVVSSYYKQGEHKQ